MGLLDRAVEWFVRKRARETSTADPISSPAQEVGRSFEEIMAALQGGPGEFDKDVSDSRIVLFETLWSDPADGWAIASRANARAMKESGVDVRLLSWAGVSPKLDDATLDEVRTMLKPPPRDGWGFYIFSCTLAGAKLMMDRPLPILLNMRAPRTFYTTFERLNIEPELVAPLNQLDGIWVPCSQNLEVLEKAGVKNVSWIPFPYFDDDPHLKLEPPSREPRTFYWIGRWEPRKAPDNLLRAFLRAFKPGETRLVMKTSPILWHGRWPSIEDVIKAELAVREVITNGWTEDNWNDSIEIITGRLTKEEMVALHAAGDVYVTASRGEGTDLPALQAKLSGRRLVTTDSGGPRDFLGERDILVPPSGVTLVDPVYEWGQGALYTDYKLADLVAALQKARSGSPDDARGHWPKDRFHCSRVGAQLQEWIKQSAARADKSW